MHKLTAKQIKWIDVIKADKHAAKLTLMVALTYHQNVLTELNKREREFWDDVIESNDLDKEACYSLKTVDGCYSTIEIDDDEPT